MKKGTAGIALAAAAGFGLLSATPAFAVPYPNCTAAELDGVFNIPSTDSRYGIHLDRDRDGIGCENPNVGPAAPETVPEVPGLVAEVPGPVEEQQVGTMPEGGADTGVAIKPEPNMTGVALAGGLVLAAAAGGVYVVRRRSIS